jgi:hypothetical protein
MTLLARGPEPSGLSEPLRLAVLSVDPTVPLFNVATMEERHRSSLATARFNTLLLTLLGLMGLTLAAIGIYGVLAYFVGRRGHEIALRMALGAPRRSVMLLVMAEALPRGTGPRSARRAGGRAPPRQ